MIRFIRKNIQYIAVAGVVLVVGWVSLSSGGSAADPDVAKFKEKGNDFARFSVVRVEGNDTRPRPIADENAQKALGVMPEEKKPEPLAVGQTQTKENPPEVSPKERKCASAWDADESCAAASSPKAEAVAANVAKEKTAGQEPVQETRPSVRAPSTQEPKPERPKAVHLVSTSSEAQKPVPRPSQASGRMDLSAYEQQLIAMSSAKGDAVTGRDVRGNMDILKKGSRYLGIINEAMIVRAGEKHDVTIDVVARLSNNTTVKPFLLYGEAKLNRSGTRVEITVTDCIAADAAAESIPCKGVIQDHRGVTGLDGDSYNPAHYANALKLVSAVVGGGFVAMKTTSRTLSGGILYDQTFGNGVLDALAGSVVDAGKDEADEIKSEGKRVEIAPGAFVQVLVAEDVALW